MSVQQSGIHTGLYLGIPPTNKLIKFEYMNNYKIKDRQIINGGGVRKGSFLFQIGKTIIAENIDTSVEEYMKQLKKQGLIK